VRSSWIRLARHIDLEVHEVPSGTPVFDWTIPREWNVRDAYIKNAAGERIVDFRRHNLHVLNYSAQVNATLPLAALKQHVHATGPARAHPLSDLVLRRELGFCMAHRQFAALPDSMYEGADRCKFGGQQPGHGENLHQGETDDEVLLSLHICHALITNDNCSGLRAGRFVLRKVAVHRIGMRTLHL